MNAFYVGRVFFSFHSYAMIHIRRNTIKRELYSRVIDLLLVAFFCFNHEKFITISLVLLSQTTSYFTLLVTFVYTQISFPCHVGSATDYDENLLSYHNKIFSNIYTLYCSKGVLFMLFI